MIEKITGWIFELVINIFTVLWDFIVDVAIFIFDAILTALATVISAIPAPSFLAQNSMTSLLGSMGPDVMYFISAFNLPACFAILGAGFMFRMTRKIFTLGQW